MIEPNDSFSAEIGVGIIGLGFMGRTHLAAYAAAQADGLPCGVRAVCDHDPSRLYLDGAVGGNIDAATAHIKDDRSQVRFRTEPADLFSDRSIHLISICTYTDSHVPLATQALHAGKHVLVEKPVALRSIEVMRLADAARMSGRLCMPGMCMRFWPGWDWLHDRIRERTFGELRGLTLTRMGSRPTWADAFYGSGERSGGALIDLHIHDVDFIVWCLGTPHAVFSSGNQDHLTTSYRFGNGAPVVAEASWLLPPSAGFRMRYIAVFEGAAAEFDLSRSAPLLLHQGDQTHVVPLQPGTGYDGEVRHLARAIAEGRTGLRSTLDDAARVMAVLEAERASLNSHDVVRVDADGLRARH